jgi:hypothetical protein
MRAETEEERTEVVDADLLAELEKVRGGPAFDTYARHLARMQHERNAKAARHREMTPIQRRRDEIRELIAKVSLGDADRYHIHSVIALCGLPYRRPLDEQADYVREYGRNSLVVQPGYLKDPLSGKMVRQGTPYGPKARLIMLHICTMALRQNSYEIEVADSMSAFIRDLGFAVTGGERGTINQFKEQLHRLAAARMQIGLWDGNRSLTVNSQPIEAFDIWLPRDSDQRMLWSSTLILDERFYRTLKEHALPVDIRTLRAFASSARQIDIILWMAYRLRSVKRPYLITWELLKEQFGAGVKRDRKFREEFADDIRLISEVIPNLPAKLSDRGLMLYPSDPERLFVPPKPKLPKLSRR